MKFLTGAVGEELEDLIEIATFVRAWLERYRAAATNHFFRFPIGCCEDASILLGQKILVDMDRPSTVRCGRFELNGVPHSHAWLNCNGFDVDITADQFCIGRIPIEVTKKHFLAGEIRDVGRIDCVEYRPIIDGSPHLRDIWFTLSMLSA